MKILKQKLKKINLTKIGGLNNSNYIFQINNKRYILRIPSKDNKNNFINEGKILDIISPLNISPLIKYHNTKGVLVSEFIPSSKITLEIYNSKAFIYNTVLSLKKLHTNKCDIFFNPFNEIYKNIDYLKDINYNFQHDLNGILNKLKYIEEIYRDNMDLGLCHNDLNTSNILYTESNVFFVDFEFSGIGDIFFDLATLSWFLNDKLKMELLNSYFGYFNLSLKEKLDNYIFVVKLWNATWSFIKSINSNSHYDYRLGGNMILDDLINNYL